MTDLSAELSLCTTIARAAGLAILAVKNDARARPTAKSDESPVTLADLAADKVIRAELAHMPGVVVTEETWRDKEVGAHPRVWCVDPLDGTEDFVAGRPDYVVQIGLVEDGVPVLGVVYAPESGITWRGYLSGTDRVCERVDATGAVHARSVHGRTVGERPRLAVSVAHPSALLDIIVNELGCVAVPRGSVGLKVGMILDDEADAYLTASRRIKVWDTCAPAAILRAAGGVVSALDQRPLRYDAAAAHDAGVCMWTPAAQRALTDKLARTLAAHAPRA